MTRPSKNGEPPEFNTDAYEAFLEGTCNQDPQSIVRLLRAEDAFRRALDSSPNYARAMAELAYTLVLQADSRNFTGSKTEVLDEAEALSQNAVDLDGGHDYAVHWTRGFLGIKTLAYSDGLTSFARAEELFWNKTDTTERRSGLMMEYAEALTDAHTFGNIDSHDEVKDRDGNQISPIAKAVAIVDDTLRHPDWYYWVAAYVYSEATDIPDHLNKALDLLGRMKYRPGDAKFLVDSLILQSQIHERLGDPDKADEALQQWLEIQAGRIEAEQQELQELDPKSMKISRGKLPADPNGASHQNAANRLFAELSELEDDPQGETERIKAWRNSLRTVLERNLEKFGKYDIPIDKHFLDT